MVDGERFDILRLYSFPGIEVRYIPPGVLGSLATEIMSTPSIDGTAPSPFVTSQAASSLGFADQIVARALMAEAMSRVNAVQQRLDNDVRLVQQANAAIDQTNERVLPLMQELTGQNFGADRQQWQTWWADQLGLVAENRYSDKPTVTDFVSLPNVPWRLFHHACFAAGTMVQTASGPRAIESLTVGDRVLSQDTSNGSLAFQPVLAAHVNGPAETLRIAIDGETIVATGIHRFWKAGKGWVMARELRVDDPLRTIGGIKSVESIQPGPRQLVYNLDVAMNRNFLVGTAGSLVHDFSFVRPVAEPFDRQANASASAK
jgi:hypothetical protein